MALDSAPCLRVVLHAFAMGSHDLDVNSVSTTHEKTLESIFNLFISLFICKVERIILTLIGLPFDEM